MGWGGGLSRDKLPADRCVPSMMQLSATRHYSSLWKQGMLTRHWPLVRGLRGPDGCPMPLQVCQTGRPEGGPATQPDCPKTGGRGGVCLQRSFALASRQTLPGETPLPTWASSSGPQEEERCSPRSTGPSGGGRARLAGAVSCSNHSTAIGGRGPALPRQPLPPGTRKWPWARGAGLGRLAMRQAGGRGRRRRGWPGGRCLPRRTAPLLRPLSLSAREPCGRSVFNRSPPALRAHFASAHGLLWREGNYSTF